jgi:hypothetical protein
MLVRKYAVNGRRREEDGVGSSMPDRWPDGHVGSRGRVGSPTPLAGQVLHAMCGGSSMRAAGG